VKNNDRLRINEQIRISPVVVIDHDGKNLGSLPLRAALDVAAGSNLDLVEISPASRPPVCRVMDYGKFRFDQNLKEKKNKKVQSKSCKIKEIRLSPAIQEHDVETKVKSAIKFLQSGYKINVRLEFRRRQIAHQDIGIKIMDSFLDRISDFGKPAAKPKSEGKIVFCMVDPCSPESKDASGKIVEDIQ
jgi:translation initiation factor IF-3